jgi:hypothetical protein
MGKIVVVDYAFVHPTLQQLKAAGVTAVGRYFGQATPPKNLTKAEAQLLTDNGIDVFSIFEYGAQQVLGGAPQAKVDVALFKEQAKAIGVPNKPVYFAADFDIPDYAPSLPETPANAKAKLGHAGDYWQVVRDELGSNSGGYGGYWLIKRLFDAGLIHWGYQTVAWSGSQWDPRAQLRQLAETTLGKEADVDIPERTDFGQWNLKPVVTPPPVVPPPLPPPVPGPTKAEALAAADLLVSYLKS